MRHRRPRLLYLLALMLLLSGFVAPVASAEQQASFLAQQSSDDGELHGLDPDNFDITVDPGEDFYEFANGQWLDNNEIPSNFASWGVFDELSSNVAGALFQIVADLDPEPGTDAERLYELYQQAVDTDERDDLGIEPLEPALLRIDDIHSMADALNYHQDALYDGVDGLFSLYSGFGFEDSTIYVPGLLGPTLSLPSTDYYLDDSDDMQLVREEWINTTADLLGYLGYSDSDAVEAASAVMELETAIAKAMTPEADRNDIQTYNNPRTIAELQELVPDLDWNAWIESVGWDQQSAGTLLVDDINYVDALAGILDQFGVEDLKDYYRVQLIWNASGSLSEEIANTAFEFSGEVLQGVDQPPTEDEIALSIVASTFPDTLGQLYVEQYFSPEAKAAIEELVGNLIDAFRARIENVTWMSDATKQKAVEKLDAMGIKVGYPDEWQTYEDVAIEDSLFATLQQAANVSLDAGYASLGSKIDKTQWNDPVFTVNAYYSPLNNEIVFPAAILQPPFFDPEADPASNYGAIGYVIGHEITHGFDISGSQFDADGNVSSWWTDDDRAAFEALNDRVAALYGDIEVQPDLFIDGQLTLTENVADLGGIQTAYDALQVALGDLTPEETAQLPWMFTQNQRFFIAAATVWRGHETEEYTRLLVAVDSHSPGEVRAVLPAQNMDEFYEAFEIGPGDEEYLPPDERIVIW